MNANELADEFYTYAEPHDWGKQAQAMLRQQQAELDRAVELYTDKAIENEALEKEVKHWQDAFHKGVRT